MFDLATALKALKVLGPAVAALPEVKRMIEAATSTLREPDQTKAKAAYADLIADSDAGHARLQKRLDDAAGDDGA